MKNLCAHPLLILGLLTTSNVLANMELDTQEITGHTNQYPHLSEQPVRIELVSRQAIEEGHAVNLAEALEYSAGVQLKPITGKSGSGVWLQGYDSDRVAVLIDGNPVAAGTGSSVDISQIAVGDVERIEISKGSMSAIYGTSAMGGVVNVITRQPEQGRQANLRYIGGSWGDQDLPYGTVPFGKQHLNLTIGQASGKNSFQLVSDTQLSSGFRAPDSNESQGWEGYKSNVSAKSIRQLSDSSTLMISPRLYREDIKTINDNFIGGIGNVPKQKVDITDKNSLISVFEKDNGDLGKLKIIYSFEDYQNESRQDLINTSHIEQHRITDIDHQGITAQYNFNQNHTRYYMIGVEALLDGMNATSHKNDGTNESVDTEVNDKTLKNTNGFFQLGLHATPDIELLYSGRVNNNSRYGTEFSPMFNMQYTPFISNEHHINIRLGGGYGYRTPTLKELYHFFNHSHIGYVLLGNENLEPESSTNMQASLEYSSNNFRFDMSVYQNDIKNLIDFYINQDKTNELTSQYGSEVVANEYANINKARTSGFEFSSSYELSSWITTNIGYAYLNSENLTTGKTLTSRPEHDIKTSLDFYLTHKNKFAIKYQYYSKQFSDEENLIVTPSYSQFDLKWNYYPSQHISLFAGIDNLTNVQRDFSVGSDLRPTEGRYMYLGIAMNKLNF